LKEKNKQIIIILDGEHTTVKTVVTSKVGGLASFITKKDKCIGCKTVLQEQGKCILRIVCC
jgi:hypothetical protein